MSSRKMRETLESEEEVGDTSKEYLDGIEYIKSYAKYFKSTWTEINKLRSKDFDTDRQAFGIKISQLLSFINEHSTVIKQFTIIYLYEISSTSRAYKFKF